MLKKLRGQRAFLRPQDRLEPDRLALSLTIIVVAVIVLYHILRDIDTDDLLRAIKTTDRHTLIVAGLFVAAGYFTLTFYDLFALRTIGRAEVPYRVAALSGFTSYAIGHNVGASVFSGGAVRYRIYSTWGLCGHRSHQNLLHRRAHLLARQRHCAGLGHTRGAAGGARARPDAAVVQPRARAGPAVCCSLPTSLGFGSDRA